MRQLLSNEAINNIWDELLYTHARLSYDEHAKDLAAPFATLIEKTEDAWKAQRAVWRAETESQANADAVSFCIDERTLDFALVLEGVNLEHPQGEERQSYYLPIPAKKMVALTLEAQMPYIERFASSLPRELDPELQAFVAGFIQDVTAGKEAITQQHKAADERRDNRVRVIAALVEEINNNRAATLAELVRRRTLNQKSWWWPESFFRRKKQNSPEARERELKQQTLLGVFSCRDLEVSAEVQDKINRESNQETLLAWIIKAATAATAEEALS